jgi:hypothetical protein
MGRHKKIDTSNLPTDLAGIDAELGRIEVRAGELKTELRGLEAQRSVLQERRSSAARLDMGTRLVAVLGIDEAAYMAADDAGRDAMIAQATAARKPRAAPAGSPEISGAGGPAAG